MRVTDVEDRVRQMHWPEPSPALRVRVLSDAPVAERPTTWTARVARDPAVRAEPPMFSETTRHAERGWRRFGVLAGFSLLLIIGSCAGLDVAEGQRVDAEVARFEARYGSLDESTLVVPAVPAADNRAHVVRAAAALTVPLPGLAYHHITFPAPSPVPGDLRAFAEANREAIRLAGDVRTRRQSNWEIDYRGRSEALPYQSIRILSDAIYLTALLDLEAGRADDATRMVATGLGVSASLRQEPEAFAQHVRINDVARRQVAALREIVTGSEPSPRVLEELAGWLAENRTPDPMLVSILSAVKGGNTLFARMENGDIDPATVTYIYPMTWPSWPSAFLGSAARIGRPFVRQARVRYLQYMGQLLDVLSSPRPHPPLPEPQAPPRWALVDRLTDKFTAGSAWNAVFADDFLSELGAAELAVALRRFRLDRGVYPDDPSVLVPRYLASLPIDPYTGRPPVYARQGAGFTLRPTGRDPELSRRLEWNVPK
jgi:hypothetical protein